MKRTARREMLIDGKNVGSRGTVFVERVCDLCFEDAHYGVVLEITPDNGITENLWVCDSCAQEIRWELNSDGDD